MGVNTLDERFTASDLDPEIWTTSYLPAWSSRREAAATYEVSGDGLRLSIPPEQGLWCADLHDGPLRVSAVQTGNWSGPIGSTRGQQPFKDGLVVREQQPTVWGYTPHFGRVEVACRATISPRSMFSAWMVGLEDEPDRCGEICIVEVFGDTIVDSSAAIGTGIHAFRDPRLREEFSADLMALDVVERHVYAVDWRRGHVEWSIDGQTVRTAEQAPDYPMQLILGVFDFPDLAATGDVAAPTTELVVTRVTGSSAAT